MTKYKNWDNPLGTKDISKLILEFSIPAIISFLVGALYNIVDQIFIGQGVGILGNAATNVAFPLVNLSISIALLIGAGGAAAYNLYLGARDYKKAEKFAGNAASYLIIFGIFVVLFTLAFLEPLLKIFGATDNILELSKTYAGITAFGLPFMMFSGGYSALIRGDGSPKFSMMCTLVGAIVNTILDPIFIFGLELGIAGAAYATVIGQFLSFVVTAYYLKKMRNVSLKKDSFIPSFFVLKEMARLGMAPFINQLALMFFQIVLNNTLTYYGARSDYGSDIPLAVVGVISKVNIIYLAFTLGICQGCQPVMGFNYGAKSYKRVKETFFKGLRAVMIISVIAFLIFQIFPLQLLKIFGKGSDLYYRFGIKYFRIFLAMTFINGIQPICSFFFTSIGKAKKGTFISLTRQIVFLIPLIIIFSRLFGIEGVLFTGPIADFAAASLAVYLASLEIKELDAFMKN
ncbi:MATE family efflux transporter [Peptoniphilus sp. GNH]|nr:MATE efflux family protein [Clostridiales bacterium KA00134]UHR02315.1 MATE family efflux transporter [Peptoniphilus sp. GNH]